jgi:hypothetical protein
MRDLRCAPKVRTAPGGYLACARTMEWVCRGRSALLGGRPSGVLRAALTAIGVVAFRPVVAGATPGSSAGSSRYQP